LIRLEKYFFSAVFAGFAISVCEGGVGEQPVIKAISGIHIERDRY
jgi:hypothetical protein